MNNIYVWLEEVCRPLKYKPDHDAAYKELKDHYQDHLDYLKDQGVLRNAAELQALEAMGDATEMRRLMTAAYRPVLTLLWRISRVLLAGLAVVVVATAIRFSAAQGEGWSLRLLFSDPGEEILSNMAFYRDRDPDTQITEYRCDDTASLGEFRFSAERILKCRADDRNITGRSAHFLVLILKAKSPIVLEAPDELQFYMTAKDDKGNFYDCGWNRIGGQYPERYVGLSVHKRIGPDYYDAWISGIDPDIEWIDLSYNHLGKSFTLHISFDEEVSE